MLFLHLPTQRAPRCTTACCAAAAILAAAALLGGCSTTQVKSAARSAILAPPPARPAPPPPEKPPPASENSAERVQAEVIHKARTDEQRPPKADVESRQMFPLECIDPLVPAPMILGGQPEHLMHPCFPVNPHQTGTTERPR